MLSQSPNKATSEAKTLLVSLPKYLLLNMMLYGLLYLSLWPAQVSCPSCVPSQKEKALTLLKYYSATAETLVCVIKAALVINPKQGIIYAAMKLTLSQSDLVQGGNFQLKIDLPSSPERQINFIHTSQFNLKHLSKKYHFENISCHSF